MKKKKIGQLDIQISDGNYSSKYPRSDEFVEFGVPFIRANNLKNNTVIDDDMYYISEEKHALLKKGHLKTGDVLITTRGDIGQTAIVPIKHNDSNINAQIVLLRTNEATVNNRYLSWSLKSDNVRVQIIELQTGTALKQLPVGRLKEIEIPVYTVNEQIEIADKLDRISHLITKLNIKNKLLDELVKARFVEMFGDPFINEKGWKTEKLSELCKINYYKGEIENNDGKVWLLNLDMIESNTGRLLDYVYENENNIPSSTMKFEKDCVLYSKLRPYLNKVIIPNKSGYATTELISMKTDIINNQFLKTLLMQQSFVDFANGTAYGAKMPRASVDSIKSFNLINPPKELQEQFASFVEQIDKSKFVIQKQRDIRSILDRNIMFNKYMINV